MSGPLGGRTVLVTRPREEADELLGRLRDLDAEAVAAPAIRLEPAEEGRLEEAVRGAEEGAFAWVAFTSATGVRAWFELAGRLRLGPTRARIAAVGTGTAEALRSRGVDPDLVPERFTTAALGEAFPAGTGRVLLPRADLASHELEGSLTAKGWIPVRVDAYRIVPDGRLAAAVAELLADHTVDAVTFTSASAVEAFAGATPARPPAVCIGPVTAEAARDAGFQVAAEADPHTIEGLVAAVVRAIGR